MLQGPRLIWDTIKTVLVTLSSENRGWSERGRSEIITHFFLKIFIITQKMKIL